MAVHHDLDLGAFSVSLAVKDLAASQTFYEKLGFRSLGEMPGAKYAILKNGEHVIGLFENMFDANILTFNPGWDQSAGETESFTDVREIQRTLRDRGIAIIEEADETTAGPAHCVIADPDGNRILIDQHR
ncbi:MAG: VOC family protein [Pseudomonadota bacterium]